MDASWACIVVGRRIEKPNRPVGCSGRVQSGPEASSCLSCDDENLAVLQSCSLAPPYMVERGGRRVREEATLFISLREIRV